MGLPRRMAFHADAMYVYTYRGRREAQLLILIHFRREITWRLEGHRYDMKL